MSFIARKFRHKVAYSKKLEECLLEPFGSLRLQNKGNLDAVALAYRRRLQSRERMRNKYAFRKDCLAVLMRHRMLAPRYAGEQSGYLSLLGPRRESACFLSPVGGMDSCAHTPLEWMSSSPPPQRPRG